MGSREERMTDARPWHCVYVDGYWMDRTEVTNQAVHRVRKSYGICDGRGAEAAPRGLSASATE
jgi:hypothetical protein